MSQDKKDGGVELLRKHHFDMTNPWGQDVVGWKPTNDGLGSLHNPRGFAMLRVVAKKFVGDAVHYLYDQPILIENPGSIVIAQLGDRVGLIKNFRMVGERLFPDAGSDYILRLEQERRWAWLVDTLGAWRWECPRGLVPPNAHQQSNPESLNQFVFRTAKLEALEEAGYHLEGVRIAGRVNMNSTFFPHAQYVVHAHISAIEEAHPEPLETIGAARLFTMEELRALNQAGEFDDGPTLAALALCGMHL